MKLRQITLSFLLLLCTFATAADVVWFDGQHSVSYQVVGKTDPVVKIALEMFCSDIEQVTGRKPVEGGKRATIVIKQGNGADDGFRLSVKNNQILVEGHNGRGAAYGLLELSRMAGVSPWVWWGDVVPERKARLSLPDTFSMEHTPSVAYRGIFINDEDWSLRNWAWKHYENNGVFGQMGPKTYKAVFQLLLRLRANTIWPAMHTGTPGFFTVPGNKEMADSCGILIGTSHCEPLLRNNVAEWDHSVRGAYNYITNREQVQQYWIERLKEVKGSEEFFTIGMRGIHDGSMEGVHTKKEKLEGLQQVINDQRELISKYYLGKGQEHRSYRSYRSHKTYKPYTSIEQVPQVFIPYKEVLEILESGLQVPDDVTLMWCDDNYGYMTRLSDAEQQKRSGGGGVYYHLSYWGRPHDYIWLTTTQPGLVYNEMKAAYDHNCRKLWIVNVHDPKVAAYDLELFLDMAWDIKGLTPNSLTPNSLTPSPSPKREGSRKTISLEEHLERWLCTQFGNEAGKKLFPAMKEFYRLCGIRKPEFMGWTQVELDKKIYPRGRSQVIDTEFSLTEFGNEVEHYLSDYEHICQEVQEAEKLVRPELKDAFFAAVKYPVLGARAMAAKMLEAQMARSKYLGQTDKALEGREDYMMQHAAQAMYAYRDIQRLTAYYNDSLAGGKWKGIMNMMPRDLPVFNPPILPYLPREESYRSYKSYETYKSYKTYGAYGTYNTDYIAGNACKYTSATEGVHAIQMLGHSMNAVSIPKGCEVVYEFEVQQEGEAVLYTAMIPTQPNDKGDLRYQVCLDNQEPVVISLKEKYRSEFWKTSVLRGQTLKQTPVSLTPRSTSGRLQGKNPSPNGEGNLKGKHTLKIKALDDHIIFDQWMLDFKKDRKFYVIPVS